MHTSRTHELHAHVVYQIAASVHWRSAVQSLIRSTDCADICSALVLSTLLIDHTGSIAVALGIVSQQKR
jgi:hypothetical protein